MTILSKAEIGKIAENSLGRRWMVGEMLNLLETCLAMRAALEGWAAWCVDETHTLGGDLFDRAIELTAAAGIDWPEEGDA